MEKKIFYTKTAIKNVDGRSGPAIREVKYIGADGLEYTGLEFEGVASTPTLDKGGDIVLGSAFNDSLQEFMDIGAPMLLQHEKHKQVGNYTQIQATDRGLDVKGLVKLDIDNVFKALRTGVLGALSIGYSIEEGEWEGDVFIIKKLRLHEISLVSIGMNQEALIKKGAQSFKDEGFKNIPDEEVKKLILYNNTNYTMDKTIEEAVKEFTEPTEGQEAPKVEEVVEPIVAQEPTTEDPKPTEQVDGVSQEVEKESGEADTSENEVTEDKKDDEFDNTNDSKKEEKSLVFESKEFKDLLSENTTLKKSINDLSKEFEDFKSFSSVNVNALMSLKEDVEQIQKALGSMTFKKVAYTFESKGANETKGDVISDFVKQIKGK